MRDRPGQAGGKTSRPFPRETIESAIPEDGSVRNPYADPDKGYPSMRDEDLVDRLEGFYLHHKARGLGVHDGRLMYEFTRARCLTYRDFSNARQLSFGHSIQIKYASRIFRDGFRATPLRTFVVWTLLRAHALRKLGVTLSASEIATLASADMHTGSVRTAWRSIGELEEKGFLIRTNTYRNRKPKDGETTGRKINFGANTYIAGPRLLAILEEDVSDEVIKDRIVRARRAKRARWQRMRSGEGSEAPALNSMSFGAYVVEQLECFQKREDVRVEMQMIDNRADQRIDPIAREIWDMEEWAATMPAGSPFRRVSTELRRAAQERSEVAGGIPETILEGPEPKSLREAAEAIEGLDWSEVQAAIDDTEVVSAIERAAMVEFEDVQALERVAQEKRAGEQKRCRGISIREQLEKALGDLNSSEEPKIERMEVPARSQADCEKASKTYGLNTMPFLHGIPLGISNGKKIRKPKLGSATELSNSIQTFPPPRRPSEPEDPTDPVFFPPKPDSNSSSNRRHLRVESPGALSEEIRRTAEEAAASGNRFAQILLLGSKPGRC